MADILLIEGRGSLTCPNCGLTREHKIELFYDDDNEQLKVVKTCGCDDESGPYVETRIAPVEIE